MTYKVGQFRELILENVLHTSLLSITAVTCEVLP